MDFQRNRLVLGGVIGLVGCFLLFGTRHQVWGTLVLILGFISSVRAIFNGAPIIGFFLMKATGILILMLPMLWVASENFAKEKETWAQSEPRRAISPATTESPKKEEWVKRPNPPQPEQVKAPAVTKTILKPVEPRQTQEESLESFVKTARELEGGR